MTQTQTIPSLPPLTPPYKGGGYNFWTVLACLVLPSLLYFNALKAPFVFDDLSAIANNPDIKKISNVKTKLIYRAPSYRGRNHPARPLTYFTFMLNYHFGKLNTLGYHLLNLALHLSVTLLIFVLSKKVFFYAFRKDAVLLPLFAALFFSAHPMNVDVVSHIVHRSDSLVTFFYLTSLYLFIKSREATQHGVGQNRHSHENGFLDSRFRGNDETRGFQIHKLYYPLSLICFVLSFASKQIASTLPAMVLLFDFIFLSHFKKEKVLQKKYLHLPYWILLFAMVSFLYLYLGELEHILPFEGTEWSRINNLMTQPYVILNYIKLLVVPVGQCIDHFVIPAKTLYDPRVLIYALFYSGLFTLAYIFCKKVSSFAPLIVFSLAWFFVTLMPTSSIFPLVNDAMAEKRVYLPGWGFYLVVVSLYASIPKKKIRYALLLLHLLLLSVTTWKRNRLYLNPVLLWEEVVARYPQNDRGYLNLGFHYGKNDMVKAQEYFEKAVAIDTKYDEIYSNLGDIYRIQKEYHKAIPTLQKAIILDPNNSSAYNTLGIVYGELKNYGQAAQFFRKALELNPDFTVARENLRLAQQLMGQSRSTIKEMEATLQSRSSVENGEGVRTALRGDEEAGGNSSDPKTYNNLGNFYAKQKEYAKAIGFYQKALEINPRYDVACYNLGNVYRDQKEYERAIEFYRKAIEINPHYAQSHYNMGNIYSDQKKYREALKEYQMAQKLVPDNPMIQEKIEQVKKLLR